jgi:hypothetical protein
MAFNDQSDWRWDERVLKTMSSVVTSFRQVCDQLSACLARFDGYAGAYSAALGKVEAGQRARVGAHDRDSCQAGCLTRLVRSY